MDNLEGVDPSAEYAPVDASGSGYGFLDNLVELGSETEAELAMERFLDHLENWLLVQPEVLLLWQQPRNVRRDLAQAIAKWVTTIPVRAAKDVPMNRKNRRHVLAVLKKQEGQWWQGIKV